jgi:predicted AAA+ superfamily ATPase
VKSHYQLLQDMFIGFEVPAFSGSPRKHVLSTPRFYFFDLGVRHAAAGLAANRDTVLANPGPLFEQWVAIEIHKRLAYARTGRFTYFRTKAGAKIDFVVEVGKRLVPVEVKWTEDPSLDDARHLVPFLSEQRARAPVGYVVCRCERPRALAPNVLAIPWWHL